MRLPDDVAPWKYNKLMSNLGNVVGALTAEAADATEVVAAVRSEGENVLRDAESNSSRSRRPRRRGRDGPTIRPVPGWNAGPSNSTWQSLSRSTGNVETDFLNGEIVRLAHRHGITAPLNAALARAARAAVRNGMGQAVTRRRNWQKCWGWTRLPPDRTDPPPTDSKPLVAQEVRGM